MLNVPIPTANIHSSPGSDKQLGSLDESSSNVNHSDAYHWDCSDWVRRSHNPLPNITEVPGSEVPDSSSFHSNESNESHSKAAFISQGRD